MKALNDADWESLLPRLTAYAEQRLRRSGWASGRDHEPNRLSVMETVNEAVDRCLDGRRQWDEADPPELGALLCGVIKSIVSDERKKFVREQTDLAGDNIDQAPDLTKASNDDDGPGAVCAAVEACALGEEDLELFRLAVLDGHTKRDDIADALGWSPDRVTAARVKLQRRLIRRFPSEFAAAKQKRRAS